MFNVNKYFLINRFMHIPVLKLDNIQKDLYSLAFSNISLTITLMSVLIYIKPKIYGNIIKFEEGFYSESKFTILVQKIPLDLSEN